MTTKTEITHNDLTILRNQARASICQLIIDIAENEQTFADPEMIRALAELARLSDISY